MNAEGLQSEGGGDDPARVRATWQALSQMPAQRLHAVLALRATVFVVEQQSIYCDPDPFDAVAAHLMLCDADGALLATLRMLPPATRFAEPSLGRVCVARAARGLGLGRRLVRAGLARCAATHPGLAVRIAAQAHLQAFYEAEGFDVASAPFGEDGIAHVEMLCPAARLHAIAARHDDAGLLRSAAPDADDAARRSPRT